MNTPFYRKIHSIVIVIAIILSIAAIPPLSANGLVDFNVKISTAGDETYATSMGNVSRNNTDITFQFIEVSDGAAEEYSLNLPTGFVYQSRNTAGNTCANFSILNASNGNYHFSFNGAAGCLAKTEFTYRVTPTSVLGNQNIFLLGKNGSTWTIVTNATLWITSTNSITRASTADLNTNGYIDAYVLSFATNVGVNASSLSWITINGATTASATASGSDWIVPFTDGIFKTADLPQIGGVFDTVALWISTVNEEDKARPQIMTINGIHIKTLALGQSVSLGTGSFDIGFSERMIPSSLGAFSLSFNGLPVSGGFAYNGTSDTLTFSPTSTLQAGTYIISWSTGATDWSAGSNSLSGSLPTLTAPDTTSPTGSAIGANIGIQIYSWNPTTSTVSVPLQFLAADNIGVSGMMISNNPAFTGAVWESYTTGKANWILASSALGVQTVYARFRDIAGNVSPDYSDNITIVAVPVAPPSRGGWGPSPDYCPTGDKSGNFYDSKCNAPITGTGITNTGSTSTGVTAIPIATWIPSISTSPDNLSSGTMDTKYFSTLAEARKYLLGRITHRAIVKLINSYGDKLIIPDESYFLSVDRNLYSEYNRVINAYVLLFLRVQDAVSGNRSSTVKSEGRNSTSVVMSGITLAKNFLDRYVIREPLSDRDNAIVYRAKNPLLTKPLLVLEKKVLAKFHALLESETITDAEYNTALQSYNDFTLHLSIYRDYGKSNISKERALSAIKSFMATYQKKVGQ